LSQEDENEKEDEFFLDEESPDELTDQEVAAGRAIMMSLIHTLQLEQSKANLYFMLIPLAFSVGLLLGYYISFINL
jgi:hypothetical protein